MTLPALSAGDQATLDSYVANLTAVRVYDFKDSLTDLLDNRIEATYASTYKDDLIIYLNELDSSLTAEYTTIADNVNVDVFLNGTVLADYLAENSGTILATSAPDFDIWVAYYGYLRRSLYVEGSTRTTLKKIDDSGNPIYNYIVDDEIYWKRYRFNIQGDDYISLGLDETSFVHDENYLNFKDKIEAAVTFINATPEGRPCNVITMDDMIDTLLSNAKFITFRDTNALFWKKPENAIYTDLYNSIKDDVGTETIVSYIHTIRFAIIQYIYSYVKIKNFTFFEFRNIDTNNPGYSASDKSYTPLFSDELASSSTYTTNQNLLDVFSSNLSKYIIYDQFTTKFKAEYPTLEYTSQPGTLWSEPKTIDINDVNALYQETALWNALVSYPNIINAYIKNDNYYIRKFSAIDVYYYEMYLYDYYNINYVQYFYNNFFNIRYINHDLYFITLKDYISNIDDTSQAYDTLKRYILNIDLNEFKELFREVQFYHFENSGSDLTIYSVEKFQYEIMSNEDIISYVKNTAYENNDTYYQNLRTELIGNTALITNIDDFYALFKYFVQLMVQIYKADLNLFVKPYNILEGNYYIIVNNTAYMGEIYNKITAVSDLPGTLTESAYYVINNKEITQVINDTPTNYPVESDDYVELKNGFAYFKEVYKSYLFKNVVKMVRFNIPPLSSTNSSAYIGILKSNVKPKKTLKNVNKNLFNVLEENIPIKNINHNINIIHEREL